MKSLMKRQSNDVGSRLLDTWFEDFFTAPSIFANRTDEFMPRVDIRDAEDHLAMTFEVPGMKKDDIKVSVKEGILTVSGSREITSEEDHERYVRREIQSGSFSRQFSLPKTVRTDNVNAEYKNGILEIRLAKLEEAKPKEVEIKVS